MEWKIYLSDREYARENVDPCFGVVEAETKAEAEQIASEKSMLGGHLSRPWAVACKPRYDTPRRAM